jgi:hypothetical protein
MINAICGKIGAKCHVSRETAKHDFVPFIKSMLQKQKSSPIASWFKLTPEEVDFLIQMNRF